MDDNYLHVSLNDTDGDGHADSVGYSTWHYHGDRYVDVSDFNLDGQPDIRRTETGDGGGIDEAWVGGKWQEIIFKEGIRLADSPEVRLAKAEDGTFEILEAEVP